MSAEIEPVCIRRTTLRVQMADTDAAAILYMAAPVRWAEGLFSGWLADSGHPLSALMAADRGFPTVTVHVDYHAPVRMDDQLHARLWIERTGNRSLDLRSEFVPLGGSAPSVEVRTRHVYSSLRGDDAVASLPGWVRQRVAVCQPA